MKILSFVRVFESYGFLVQMIKLTINDTVPFLVFFFIFVLFFTLITIILKVDLDDETYVGIIKPI